MNRTVQISRIKLTIFFVTGLFAMTLLIQSPAWGQIVKPGSPIITGKPTIHPDISNRLLPDLQIADITYSPTKCSVKIRVVNTGAMDVLIEFGHKFTLWVDVVVVDPNIYGVSPKMRYYAQYSELPANQEKVQEYSLVVGGGETGAAGWTANTLSKGDCKINKVTEIRAAVDPRLLMGWDVYAKTFILGDLITPGTAVPAGWTVEEPVIKEKNENNNELIVKKADLKLY